MKKILSLILVLTLLLPAVTFADASAAAPDYYNPSATTSVSGNGTSTNPSVLTDNCKPINTTSTLGGILNWASCTLVKDVVPLLFTLAVVGFIWGMIQFYLNPDNEEKKKNGKTFMLWGIIALFVMISMWGLVGVLGNTFGIKTLLPQLSQ